jgi:hypothetical protein
MMNRERRSRTWLFLNLAALLAPPAALAFQPQQDEPAAAHAFSRPPGVRAPELRAEPALTLFEGSSKAAAARPALQRFFQRHSQQWEVRWDERNDRPHVIQGVGIPLIPGRGNELSHAGIGASAVGELRLEDVEPLLRGFIDEHPELFRVAQTDLRLDPRSSAGLGHENRLWFVEFQQVHDGVPVHGARVYFRISHGNLVQFGTDRIAEVRGAARPRIDREEALERALSHAGLADNEISELHQAPELKLYPVLPAGERPGEAYRGRRGEGYRHRLVWELGFRTYASAATYRALVDARSGEVLELFDRNRYADAVVQGGIYPTTSSDPEELRPFPFAIVSNGTTKVTNEAGVYDYSGGTASSALGGAHVSVSDVCGSVSLSNNTTGNLDFGSSGGTNCTTPGFGGAGNTHATRTAFYHLTRINRKVAGYLPGHWWLAASSVSALMNLNSTCNAFWDGFHLGFFRAGNGCSNTGEIAAILLHEWGHAIHENVGWAPWEEWSTGEAVGDITAFLDLRDGCVGPNFNPGVPCYNCRPSCTGVRDIAAFAEGGVSTIARPDTVTSDSGIDCDRYVCPYVGYDGVMGYQGHCESHIASTAVWDAVQRLAVKLGDAEAAWSLMERLWYESLPITSSAYRVVSGGLCNPAAVVDGCSAWNWYTALLLVDDDNGNLADGTPNLRELWYAFDAHGIACGDEPCPPGTTQPLADAGPDRQVCQGGSTSLGTPAEPGHTYLWSPGGQTSAQITVSPAQTTTYTVTVTTDCRSKSDSATVVVLEPGTVTGLTEDFESGAGFWTTSGMWHHVQDSPCADPAYASPIGAMYFGQDATCHYGTGGNGDPTSGDLISGDIYGVDLGSTLSFNHFREVDRWAADTATIAISGDAGATWKNLWSWYSSTPSPPYWQTHGPVSLDAWAGQVVRLRFRFDSEFDIGGSFTGWMIDDVAVTSPLWCGPGNPPPTATPTPTPTFTPTPTPTFTPTPTPTPGAPAHVGDLDGSSSGSGNSWSATVTVTVHDGSHGPVSGATVSGTFSAGSPSGSSCTTNTAGVCSVSSASLPKKTSSVTWSVTNVTHAWLSYQPSSNHDPDGDSNGTSITVSKP